MNSIHITKDGEQMLVAEMADDHLLATISGHCRVIRELRDALDNGLSIKKSTMAIYAPGADTEAHVQKMASELKFRTERLQPYVMEACLRELNGVAKLLHEAFGRSERLAELNGLRSLTTLVQGERLLDEPHVRVRRKNRDEVEVNYDPEFVDEDDDFYGVHNTHFERE